jgi:hypothetical protein
MDEQDERRAAIKRKMDELRERIRSQPNRPLRARRDRPLPAALTADLLNATPDKGLCGIVADYVIGQMKAGAPAQTPQAVVRGLRAGIRMVYVTRVVDGQVNNGGFHQFFFNSSGKFAADAIECFNVLGLPAYAELMRRAVARFAEEGEMQSRIREQRNLKTFFESYKETTLGELDKEFYAMEKTQPLEAARIRYIREHLDEFVTS